jgi:hypothetical protein
MKDAIVEEGAAESYLMIPLVTVSTEEMEFSAGE